MFQFLHIKVLVIKSSFLHFKVFGYEVWFSALQSFCSKVHTTPYRWSSPYDVPTTFYDFCTILVHCPERVIHRKSPLWLPILVTAPNFDRFFVDLGVVKPVPGLIINCCDHIGFVMRQSGMDWTKHY